MRLLPSIALAATLVVASSAFAQHDAHHRAPPPAAPAKAAAPAARYATDATLREEMQGIRGAVAGLEHHAMGHVDQRQALALASQIEDGVRTIIANCKLPPDADAALHAIIAPLMQNAGAFKRDPKNLAVIKPMQDALAAYAKQFDDPGVDDAE